MASGGPFAGVISPEVNCLRYALCSSLCSSGDTAVGEVCKVKSRKSLGCVVSTTAAHSSRSTISRDCRAAASLSSSRAKQMLVLRHVRLAVHRWRVKMPLRRLRCVTMSCQQRS